MALVVDPDTQNIDLKAWQYCHPHWHRQMEKISRQSPEALLVPYSHAALAEIFRTAHREQITIIPCGNGTKLTWGGLTPKVDWLVSTRQLNRIVDHAVNDLTITVEAGITFADLQNHLRPHKQYLPLDPSFPDQATLGGIVATADTGSLRQRYGGVRDLLLGITMLRADGTLAKAGGKVVKNVAGYDLMKLLTGSHGSLATITELTFRLYPIQEQSQTILMLGSPAQIRQAQGQILNSVLTPAAADLLSPRLLQRLQRGTGEDWGLLLRFEAIHESITAQLQELDAIGQRLGLVSRPENFNLWEQLREALSGEMVSAKVGILSDQSMALLQYIETLTNGQAIARIHCKSGLGFVAFPHDQFLRQFRSIRDFCQVHHGFFTILDAPYRLKQQFEPWGYPGDALPLMRRIKQQFDPQNILSPQRFVGGI